MAARNDITGDSIKSKTSSQAYRDNWDAIFGKKKEEFNEELTMSNVHEKGFDSR